ncbi:RDD family protein [Aliikangiella sp. G2MR2-5]|uniref:RDD family protein n=1 Tax=Aliikangiella sp. G2MR2-5 TaxID=2788943 RepID=UPI0018AB842E|nr:RDD family protein [Aliikangiella sp. G2MR2-5]
MLDTTREVEVPEGITLELPIAGYVSRALAFIIDLFARGAIIYIFYWLIMIFGDFGAGIIMLIIFFVEWFYPVLFEVLWHGQTPGKRAMELVVVNDDGTPIDWSSSIIRNLLRFADFLPALWGFGAISMLLNRDFKRLGDMTAGTLVIHKQQTIVPGKRDRVDGLAPKESLTLDEQSAIIAYADRLNRMSDARNRELAGILSPWLDQSKLKANSESAVTQLSRIAKWLRGHG